MIEEFGADAFAVARQRLKMRIRDELPAMINLYAGVCTLLAERRARGRGWFARVRGAIAGTPTRRGTHVALRHELVPVHISVLRPSRMI
ncbi:hypothetical protein [Sphingomonas nostoxanthinifaciens]|uniref:hypothetical protein n=1 Tax=Sphingomonas nostoxanthinifaciens TaxID=2872652 RepID=UPI001CC1D6A8|nr:hypothetical protein [Sphingomonas nostoxanthinifaciens]UAK24985.1 hypothetical protein K8P63_01865 [Sphingomonas nostoxanthinifaciens]